jgi:hypothetical protein
MTTIQNNTAATTTGTIDPATLEAYGQAFLDAIKKLSGDGELPPLDSELLSAVLKDSTLPTLAAPLVSTSGLSLETLVEALGGEERKVSTKTGLETLKAHAEARKATNDKQLAEIQEQLEKMREQEKLSPLLKAFKYIAMACMAIATVAAVATGNVAVAVIMGALLVDSIITEATDGKGGIAAWTQQIAEKCGADEETAKWISFAVSMAVTVVATVATMGMSGGAAAVTMVEKVGKALTLASSIISAASTVAAGGVGIYQATLQYDVEMSKAAQKALDAILERLREAIETEQDFLKFVMEKYQNLLSKVKEIVTQNQEAQAEILTGGDAAPNLA